MLSSDRLTSARTAGYVVAVTLALVSATVFGPVVWNAASSSTNPTVAVITLEGPTNDQNVNRVTRQLREARQNDSVAAVVLRLDSPGGPASASSEFYLAVNRTASQLPVVAYVRGLAASGGYYGIAPADSIVVKSGSTVGSIGTVVQVPSSAVESAGQRSDTFIRTGPDKAQISLDGLRERLQILQAGFVGTVMQHRGDELSLSRTEVANGRAYLGATAVRNGFADEIGDLGTAIERAATLADDIEGDDYAVDYREARPTQLSLSIGDSRVTRVEGDVVYVATEGEANALPDGFVRPVRYWMVWGVPAAPPDDPAAGAGENTSTATATPTPGGQG